MPGSPRPTLKQGDEGDLVREVQSDLGIGADGNFGSDTEAAVIQFQQAHGLVPDGVVGPDTWAALDALAAPPSPLDQITQMAGGSALARVDFNDRGRPPAGYVKGMALAYGRVYCKLKAADAAALDMAQKIPATPELTRSLCTTTCSAARGWATASTAPTPSGISSSCWSVWACARVQGSTARAATGRQRTPPPTPPKQACFRRALMRTRPVLCCPRFLRATRRIRPDLSMSSSRVCAAQPRISRILARAKAWNSSS